MHHDVVVMVVIRHHDVMMMVMMSNVDPNRDLGNLRRQALIYWPGARRRLSEPLAHSEQD